MSAWLKAQQKVSFLYRTLEVSSVLVRLFLFLQSGHPSSLRCYQQFDVHAYIVSNQEQR